MAEQILVATPKPRGESSKVEIGYWGGDQKEKIKASAVDAGARVRDRIQDEIDKGVKRFLIDLSEVQWLSSAWLGWLVAWQRLTEQGGGRIAFAGVNDGIKKILDATRLSGWLQVFDTVPDALDYLQSEDD